MFRTALPSGKHFLKRPLNARFRRVKDAKKRLGGRITTTDCPK